MNPHLKTKGPFHSLTTSAYAEFCVVRLMSLDGRASGIHRVTNDITRLFNKMFSNLHHSRLSLIRSNLENPFGNRESDHGIKENKCYVFNTFLVCNAMKW